MSAQDFLVALLCVLTCSTILSSLPTAAAQKNPLLPSPPKLPGAGTSTNAELINFYLYYNKDQPMLHDKLQPGDLRSVRTSNFISAKELKALPGAPPQNAVIFLVHGYFNQYDNEMMFVDNVKNAFLEAGYRNIIVVDWQELGGTGQDLASAALNYLNIESSGAQVTATAICKMIIFLINNKFLDGPRDVHLVGHSLGAHVVGAAGECVKKRKKLPVDRITGLDPSIYFGALTQGSGNGGLDKTDGDFVDIIHTGQGGLGTYWAGLGHVDFYVNGGWIPKQQNCLNFTQPPIQFIFNLIGQCAHFRAYELFARSIRRIQPDLFGCRCLNDKAFVLPLVCLSPLDRCKDKTIFGLFVDFTTRGKFYVKVDAHLPGLT